MGSIYKRGKIWWYSYYQGHKKIAKSSKSKKKMVATELLKQVEGDLADGKVPRTDFHKVYFEDLAEDLRTDYAHQGQGEPRLRHLTECFGGTRALAITTARIKQYINQRLDEGAANGTVNRELAALKRMFKLGAQETPPKVDRAPYIPMLKEADPKQGFFESEEYLAFLQALPEHLRGVLTFAYRTGWRRAEILGLTWDCVDLEEKTVKLKAGTTKNKEARTVPLDDELLRLLKIQRLRRQGCEYVFHRNGRPLSNFRAAWNKALSVAGIEGGYDTKKGKTLHDFRRTAVRNLTRSGTQESVAMKISGHKTRGVFDRYNIVSDRDVEQAMKRQAEYLRKQENNS